MHMYIYGIHKKEHNTNKKFVHHFLIRNAPHFYGLPLDFCRKHIAALFAKRAAILANAPQFGKNTLRFHGKTPQFLEKCRSPWIAALFQDGTLSRIAAHTEG